MELKTKMKMINVLFIAALFLKKFDIMKRVVIKVWALALS